VRKPKAGRCDENTKKDKALRWRQEVVAALLKITGRFIKGGRI
jgi:hypothetical protein